MMAVRGVSHRENAGPYFTRAEREQFERDGFVVVRGLYDRDEVRQLAAWIDELARQPPRAGKEMIYLEDSRRVLGTKVLSRIEKFVDDHAGLRGVVYADKLIGRVGDLLGEPALLFKEKINFKLSGGDGFAAHQDIQPGWDEYASYFVTVLVSVDASTIDNGCLELAAGHHRRGLIGEKWKPLVGDQLRGVEFTAYPTAPGDAVFFDCFVPHRSAPNDTDQARRILYLTYNRRSEGDQRGRYFADKRRSYPPDHEREPGREYRFRV